MHVSSLKGVVHKNPTSVLKIGIQDIKETIALDALSAPAYYIKNSKTSSGAKDKDKEEKQETGVELMPHNLLAFTMLECKSTLFTVFKIKNKDSFEAYLKQDFDKKLHFKATDAAKEYETASLKKGNLHIAWNTKNLVLAITTNPDTKDIKKVFKDVLVDNKLISSTNHLLLEAIKKTKGHLVYADSLGATAIDFVDGAVVVNGKHDKSKKFLQEIIVPKVPNSSLSLHYKMDLEDDIEEKRLIGQLSSFSFFKKNNLSIDSLVQPLNGTLNFSIAGTTAQRDTIITYGYDDNFEKVAQKSVQEKRVPLINFNLGKKDTSKLKDYFYNTGTLDSNSVLKAFPLYQFTVKETPRSINFSTSKNQLVSTEKKSSYLFQVKADFKELQETLDLANTRKVFELLKQVNLYAWQEKDNSISIEGKLTAKEDHINILAQLFFGLNEDEETKTIVAKL